MAPVCSCGSEPSCAELAAALNACHQAELADRFVERVRADADMRTAQMAQTVKRKMEELKALQQATAASNRELQNAATCVVCMAENRVCAHVQRAYRRRVFGLPP